MKILHILNMRRYDDLQFSFDRVSPKADYELHTHDYHELAIIISGSAVNSTNGFSFDIEPGDVFLVEKGAAHEIRDVDSLKLYNIGFDHNTIRRIGPDLLQMPGFQALFQMNQSRDPDRYRLHLNDEELIKVKTLLDEMYAEYEAHSPGFQTLLISDFSKLLVLLSRSYSQAVDDKSSLCIARALAKMEQDYAGTVSIAELAASVNLSERHFRRLFEDICHESPATYLMNLRIKEAERLLIMTTQSITEIASTCGFYDCNYFSRLFRQRFGQSPSAYRKNRAIRR